MNKKNLYSIYIVIIVSLVGSIIYKEERINYNYNSLYNTSESLAYFNSNYKEYTDLNYFEGESVTEISNKLNKYLKSTLKGKGEYITKYSLQVGIDPYLVTAVMLQETGCYWGCSTLVKSCNNVGGNKGTPSCNKGSYRKFDSIEEGIKFAINKLNKYYQNGLTTAKEINPKYASDKTWYKKVNKYIEKLKNA